MYGPSKFVNVLNQPLYFNFVICNPRAFGFYTFEIRYYNIITYGIIDLHFQPHTKHHIPRNWIKGH
jgi:hypothetical protein